MQSQQLVLGSAQFGMLYGITNKNGMTRDSDMKKILNDFVIINKNKLDCSTSYGSAFDRVTKYIQTSEINMKFKIRDIETKSKILDNNFNYLLSHDWETLDKRRKEVVAEYLTTRKMNGSCNEIGISIYNLDCIYDALNFFESALIVQTSINILDQRILNFLNEERVTTKEIVIQARSIFLQGLLLEGVIPRKFKEKIDLKKFILYCDSNNIKQLDACLSFLKSNKLISEIIFGISNLKEYKIFMSNWEKDKIDLPWENFSSSDSSLIDPRTW